MACRARPTVAELTYTDSRGRVHDLHVAPVRGSNTQVTLFYEQSSRTGMVGETGSARGRRTYVTAECIRSNDNWHRRGVWSALRAMRRRAARSDKPRYLAEATAGLGAVASSGDVFAEACVLLNRLFSVVKLVEAQGDLGALATVLPYAHGMSPVPKGALAFFRVGDRAFSLYKSLGDRKGAFGTVFGGFYERADGAHRPVVVKVMGDEGVSRSAQELVLQICAWCASDLGPAHEGDAPLAHVTRVIFACLLAEEDSMRVDSVMIGMEPLDRSFGSWALHPGTSWRDILQCLVRVAGLLDVLQERIEFMHRDLHTENVMMRGNTPYLIDFGYARCAIKLPRQARRTVLATTYGQTDVYDRGFDLLMLMMSMIDLSRLEGADSVRKAMGALTTVMSPLRRELDATTPRSARFKPLFDAYYNGHDSEYGRNGGQRPVGKAHAEDGIRLRSDMPLDWLIATAGLGTRYRPCFPRVFSDTARRALERSTGGKVARRDSGRSRPRGSGRRSKDPSA